MNTFDWNMCLIDFTGNESLKNRTNFVKFTGLFCCFSLSVIEDVGALALQDDRQFPMTPVLFLSRKHLTKKSQWVAGTDVSLVAGREDFLCPSNHIGLDVLHNAR